MPPFGWFALGFLAGLIAGVAAMFAIARIVSRG